MILCHFNKNIVLLNLRVRSLTLLHTLEDLVKMITVKNPGIEGGSKAAYQIFINQVAEKVRGLQMEYKKLSEKLPAKLDDIFEPIIKIKIGANEIVVLCDPSASVSVILKTSSFDRLNLGYLMVTELKLHLADSTFKQAVGIKDNTGVQIKDCPALVDLVIGYMPRDPIALIILVGHS
jgi:hypothetical protein